MSQGSFNEQVPGESAAGQREDLAPAQASRPLVAVTSEDARLQEGAYVTDGVELYEVAGVRRSAVLIRGVVLVVTIENCRDQSILQLPPENVRRGYRLVRSAPAPRCPDFLEEIAW
jgi:hypothetical protein